MHILVNGTSRDIPDRTNLTELLAALNLEGQRLAVEVNEALVPRSRFECHWLTAQDRVEIIHAVGGG